LIDNLFSNGRSLGKAFEDFSENDMTYFPALSLANQEQVFVNLGEKPFKFPVQGAKSIISYPIALTDYFKRLEQNINSLLDSQISLQVNVSHINIYFNLI